MPDGPWGLVPEWMTSPDCCGRFDLVDQPEVSADALTELGAFLRARPTIHQTIGVETTPADKEARPDVTMGATPGATAPPGVDGHDAVGASAGRGARAPRHRRSTMASAETSRLFQSHRETA